MLLVFASIPLMVLAVAVAVVPLVVAMHREAVEQRARWVRPATRFPAPRGEETQAAA